MPAKDTIEGMGGGAVGGDCSRELMTSGKELSSIASSGPSLSSLGDLEVLDMSRRATKADGIAMTATSPRAPNTTIMMLVEYQSSLSSPCDSEVGSGVLGFGLGAGEGGGVGAETVTTVKLT